MILDSCPSLRISCIWSIFTWSVYTVHLLSFRTGIIKSICVKEMTLIFYSFFTYIPSNCTHRFARVYYQQHLDRQAGPSCRLPDIMLPDMMTFIALALHMGHNLKDTLHDYWSRLRQLHSPFYGETMT